MATLSTSNTPSLSAESVQREIPTGGSQTAYVFATVVLSVAAISCLLAGWAPLGFSIAIVFLFAGPHNWLEARYMLSRMPAKWGPLQLYFLIGLCGVPILAAGLLGLPFLLKATAASQNTWLNAYAVWNTVLVVWVLGLIQLRSQQAPRQDWGWTVPVGLTLIALNWLHPLAWSLGLVYLHPLLALWFLDRELRKSRSAWHSVYRWCLLVVPIGLGLLWWNLAATDDLPGESWLSMQLNMQLTRQVGDHAGGTILPGISTHLLVATHTFLEMLHYGVWVFAIPLLSVRRFPWQLDNVPLARKSPVWRKAILVVVALGGLVMIGLWAAFAIDYPLTRNVYFAVALLHVLAEFPFLIRLL